MARGVYARTTARTSEPAATFLGDYGGEWPRFHFF